VAYLSEFILEVKLFGDGPEPKLVYIPSFLGEKFDDRSDPPGIFPVLLNGS
jgi:hypothetical protein